MDKNSPENPATKVSNHHDTQATSLIIETAEITPVDESELIASGKDYSHYEVEVETNQVYEDALFSSDAELDDALAHKEQPQKTQNTTKEPEPIEQEAPKVSPERNRSYTYFDITHCLSAKTLQQRFKQDHPLFQDKPKNLAFIHQKNGLGRLLTLAKPTIQLPASSPFHDTLPKAEKKQVNGSLTGYKAIFDRFKNTLNHALNKSRIKLGIYTGSLLPARPASIQFSYIKLKPYKKQQAIASAYTVKSYFEDKSKTLLQVLEWSTSQLAILNKYQLSNNKKLAILDAFYLQCLKKESEISLNFQKNAHTANFSDQAQIAEYFAHILKHLVSGYRYAYDEFYHLPYWQYGPKRKKINHYALRLFETLCLQQRYHFIIQKPLVGVSATYLQQLHSVILNIEPCLLNESRHYYKSSPLSTHQAYLIYQVIQTLDSSQYSPRQFTALLSYLENHIDLIKTFIDKQGTLEKGLYWQQENNIDFKLTLSSKINGENLHYYLNDFLYQLKTDYIKAVKSLASKEELAAQTQASIHNTEASLALLYKLCIDINRHLEQSPSLLFPTLNPKKIQFFCGYDELESLGFYLHDIAQKKNNTRNHPAPANCHWLLYERENKLTLQTAEASLDKSVDIGQVVVSNVKKNDQTELNLGVITGVVRENNNIQLRISNLSHHFTTIYITSTSLGTIKAIAFSDSEKFYLLLPHQEAYFCGKTLDFRDLNNEDHTLCIKSLVNDYGRTRLYEVF